MTELREFFGDKGLNCEEKKSYAKRLTGDTILHYIKWCSDEGFFDPNRTETSYRKKNWKYETVNEDIFHKYMLFLKNNKRSLLTICNRNHI